MEGTRKCSKCDGVAIEPLQISRNPLCETCYQEQVSSLLARLNNKGDKHD